MKTIDIPEKNHCFVSGHENPHGLYIEWKINSRSISADFYPTKFHQGSSGLVHGGIFSAILDEAMAQLAWEIHGEALIAELTVRFINQVRVGEKLRVTGELGELKGKVLSAKSEIRNHHGRLIAAGSGKIHIL